METIKEPMVEYGVAKLALPGQGESGDHHVVRCNRNGVLIAAIDGIGHGEEAADAARIAAQLRPTRGVVLSVASIDPAHGMMTWIGVGNVQGVLMRADTKNGNPQETLLLRSGVVGSRLPPLQATVIPVAKDDTLFFVTDGVSGNFVENLPVLGNPQRAADRILERYRIGTDDALVLIARLVGIRT